MKNFSPFSVPILALLLFALTLPLQKARAQVNEYLKLTSSKITVNFIGTPNVDLWYSENKSTWTPITESGTVVYQGNNTKTYYFKGDNGTNGFCKDADNYVSFILNGGTVAGNVMSLVNSTNDNPTEFITNSTIPTDYCFYSLFRNNTSTNSLNASELSLPAEHLTDYCYSYMFYGCLYLYNPPQLPTTVLASHCYFHMFDGCGNLKYCPELPAINLEPYCYAYMFNNCYNLYSSNNYSAPTSASGCLFRLPAEELVEGCYQGMFINQTAPGSWSSYKQVEIMATSMVDRRGNDIQYSLSEMFRHTMAQAASKQQFINLYLFIYFKQWSPTATTTSTNTSYNWFGGIYCGTSTTPKTQIYYDSDLTPTQVANSNSYYTIGTNFPSCITLNPTTPTYLTFNCAANDGTWEEGSSYNTDLRRVVRADYTAKTIPAPPVKENARFLGWFTAAEGGAKVTEEELKTITTATTVYAQFVSNNQYTLTILNNDKATITATDGTNNYTEGNTYILNSNDQTFTFTCSGTPEGWNFYKWTGGSFTDNTVRFADGQLDLVVGAVITGTPASAAKAETVYQIGTGAGKSQIFDLPAEAVDLGAAGIWAKYNVDKTNTSTGFASSETAAGSYFAWGKLTQGASTTGNFYDASSMASGKSLPVTDETDAAYRYCGHNWRIPTKDEWQTLLDNTTVATASYNQTFTSKSNSNTMTLPKNGWTNSVSGSASQSNTINYWTSTFYNWNTSTNSQSTAYGYRGGMYSSTVYSPVLNYVDARDNNNYIYYGCGIRPIFDMPRKILTVNADGHIYYFDCELYQTVNIMAVENEDDGYLFSHWTDEAGNTVSNDNPMTVIMYDDQEFTAVFIESEAEEHHVTFYDEDGVKVLDEFDLKEGRKPTYHGETPTKAGGYVFSGWSPAITKLGAGDATYTATYIKTYTVTATAAHGTIEITPADPADQVSEGVYKTGTSLTMTVTPDAGWTFTQWTGGNTSNPRTVSVTADASYTAEFQMESLPATVDAYQATTTDVQKIVYNLSAKTGLDGKTYTPVDMGYGVAWADKNVGANLSTDAGGYYIWGGTTPVTSVSTSKYYSNVASISVGYILSPAEDAATVNMGDSWRMPNNTEWNGLLDNSIVSGTTFTNKTDGTKSITLPYKGWYTTNYYGNSTFSNNNTHGYYWSSELSNTDYYSYSDYGGGICTTEGGSGYYFTSGSIYNGATVRAVYSPQYTVRTLTINVGDYSYIYYCQDGQQVTVTAHPNTAEGYVFNKWQDNNSTNATRTFTVSGNVTYTALFKDDPTATTYTVTFQNWNGTGLQSFDLIEGRIPVYSGSTPSRQGYIFTGWTDGNSAFTDKDASLPALTGDVTYTATYVEEPDYFTITNTHASQSLTAQLKRSSNVPANVTIYYRLITNGTYGDWNSLTTTNYDTGGRDIATIPAGASLQMYGTNTSGFAQSTIKYWMLYISGNGTASLSGNLMSIFSGTQTEINNSVTLPSYAFYSFFYNINYVNTKIVSAGDLKLSATNLGQYCYQNMFNGCSNLVDAPATLPATTLANSCYLNMFYGCTRLTSAPTLPAMTMVSSCYNSMFYNCSSLTTAPALPATTLAASCYSDMFRGCTSLTNVPEQLPALTLPEKCYYEMFYDCTALTTAPEIAATSATSTQTCRYMFYNCTALTQAPSELKIATLQNYTYNNMFYGCSNLGKAPTIRATTLANYGMQQMFKSCSKLKHIRYYGTTLGGTYSKTADWVNGVKSTGDFYCPPTLDRTAGTANIPSGWTVYSYNVTFIPKSCTWEDATNANKQFTWETDTTNVMTFLRAESADNAKFYTDAACTSEISVSDITAALATQKESSASTTKNYYVQKVSSYTLAWDANGGELSGEYTAAGSYSAGAAITAPTATRTGYTFDAWSPAFSGTMPSATTTYVATWNIVTYNLTYAGLNGATNSNPEEYTVETATFALANPGTREGYTFTGWTCGGNPITQITIGSTGDKTITANWSTNTHNVSWVTDGNALTGTYTNGTTAYGTTIVAPATPTKNATAQYTYTFNGWTPAVAATMPDNDVTYTATWTETPVSYTLAWTTDGNTLTGTYTHGTVAYGTGITQPNTPTKTGHTFAGWDAGNDGVADELAATMPATNTTYTAIWTANQHNVSWVTDGNTLTGEYTDGTTDYGTTIIAPNTPTKNATAQYTYTFNGWEPALDATMPDKDVTYTATWTETPVNYTLKWTTDGDALTGEYTNGTVAYGTTITAPNTPTKTGYTFKAWSPDVAETMPAENVTYTATWSTTSYTIRFLNWNGTELQSSSVAYGATPSYNGETPTKAADAAAEGYTYTFNTWSPDIATVTGDATYTATFTPAKKQYSLTWDFAGGATTTNEADYTHGNVAWGTAITAPADPTKSGFEFAGWNTTPATNMPAAQTTYTAQWREVVTTTPEIELYDNSDASVYTELLSTYAGQTVNVTLKRTFNANRWATLCLPFDFDTDGSALDGRVYELLECNVDNQTGMTITFALAPYENGVDIVAGKPYLVLIDNKLTDPRFEGVTLTSFTPLTVSKTYVDFVANIPQTTLTEKEDIFINNNRLYYPKAGGSPLRAFRAYLHIKNANGMEYAQPRVRLVVRGESGETIDVMSIDEDAEPETLKYIENGILIIERGGVRYDAQGKKLE